MCGRTAIFSPQPDIEARFDATFAGDYEPRYNIAPGSDLVTVHDADRNTLTLDEWGYVPPWADAVDDGPRPINARAETVAENRLFRDAVENRRALVVTNGFYEWQGDRGGKQPYWISPADDGLLAMAGLWSRWEGEEEARETVTIVTTEPDDVVAPIHDRMPAVLDPGAEERWLTAAPEAAMEVLTPTAGPDLTATPISTLVNDPANDSPAVLEPIGGGSGQTDLGAFGSD
jgi:putative SOS response-associated peptidase YedK